MKEKIVFFILGALIANIAYFIGDLETLTAQETPTEIPRLKVGLLEADFVSIDRALNVIGSAGSEITLDTQNGYPRIVLRNLKDDSQSAITIASKEDHPVITLGGDKASIYLQSTVADSPNIHISTDSEAAAIRMRSHILRPEASAAIFCAKIEEGKGFRSVVYIEDTDGRNVLVTE